MSRRPLSLFRRLHRSLAYSEVDDLTATQVQVSSAETALDDVLRVVREVVPVTVTTMDPELHYRSRAIGTYGILDVTYGIETTPAPISRPGLGVLRTLGLIDDAGDHGSSEVGYDFLHDLTLESEAGEMYLKVFLQADKSFTAEGSLRQPREGMPPGFWPHRFVVEDACFTNAPSIWLTRHFYL